MVEIFRRACGIGAICVMTAVLAGGCATRSRVILVDTVTHARTAADLTAREWGFRFHGMSDGRVIYQSAGLAGPSKEQLRVKLEPVKRDEVRVTVKFSGPTTGLEKVFLGDLQKNISTGTILPVGVEK
jgi:hypothetical protein